LTPQRQPVKQYKEIIMSGGGNRHFLTVAPDTWAVTGIVGTLNLVLQNYGTSGTVAGGTVAGMSDGTATVWAADTPQQLTITAAQQFVDENEWLVLKKVESAGGNDLSADATICVEYVDGITTQG
jgi:hypothetical protein